MACWVIACVRNRDGSGPLIGGFLPLPSLFYVIIISREEKKVMCVVGSRRCLSDRPRRLAVVRPDSLESPRAAATKPTVLTLAPDIARPDLVEPHRGPLAPMLEGIRVRDRKRLLIQKSQEHQDQGREGGDYGADRYADPQAHGVETAAGWERDS